MKDEVLSVALVQLWGTWLWNVVSNMVLWDIIAREWPSCMCMLRPGYNHT